ncbi:MAG: helix-turn-helix domain-containing protein, partial [Ktedonobacteraceae bacterium]|nr:helix-turn-helix domain-containing protein [Ktedonobacteraceae bacterium]
SRGEHARAIAKQLGCNDQTVRNVIHDFNEVGMAVLKRSSSRPHRLRTAFSAEELEALRALIHRSPRDFGFPSSLWTQERLAQVSFTSKVLTGEAMRKIIKKLGINWKRAKHRITSPDPQYQEKNSTRSFDCLGQRTSQLGHWFSG